MDRKAVDELQGAIGNLAENGHVRNLSGRSVAHLLGDDIAEELGPTLEELRANPQQYSVIFKDRGLRLKAVKRIAEKARTTDFPVTADEVEAEFEWFMNYCDTFMIAPTIGLFATWLGTSFEGMEDKVSHYRTTRPEVADMFDICKELLRGFLETKALDGDVAPAVYLHQNKAYFNAVETAPERRSKDTDAHIRDSSQIQEVIDLLPD